MRAEFISALESHKGTFNIQLSEGHISRLADLFDLIMQNNAVLHLVAPCSPEEFAVRHVLESLTLLRHLPPDSTFADVGTGAGLPALPCLLVRDDLSAVLIESKIKKGDYLKTAIAALDLAGRATIENHQFEEISGLRADAVTCRALDKFTEKLPRLLKWAKGKNLLLFGGPSLGEALEKQKVRYTKELMPMSEQRFLFVSTR